MRKIIVTEVVERFYIAVQDGRLDNETFDTREEAEAERKKLPKMLRASTCVMSHRKITDIL